jgi:ADP-heptose:LPS heptosyltransferase
MSIDRENIHSVLVYVGLDRLGDGLLKLPFARGLRTAFPNAHLTWFAGKETSVYAGVLAPLVADVIDEVIEYGGVGLHPSETLKRQPLKDRRFDIVIDTQRIFWTSLSAWRIRHGQFISPAAKFLLSSVKPGNGYKSPKAMQRQMLDLLEIASGMTFETPTKLNLDFPQAHHDMAAQLLPVGPCYIGFAPGSGGRPKCWPLNRYIALAELAEARGAVPVFLIGPQEEEWAAEIKAKLPNALLPLQYGNGAAAHGYNPLFTMALGSRLTAAVSNDSGIAHMLAVAGVPLIVLYGPTVYEKFPPMTDVITVIRAEKYGSRDMTAIPLDDVNQALQTMLASAPAS